jgi:hypothetical protein
MHMAETRKPVLHNGVLECRFFRFEIAGGRYRPREARLGPDGHPRRRGTTQYTG